MSGSRRALGALSVLGVLAGCGGGGDQTETTTGRPQINGPKALLYTGSTSQRQPVRIEATSRMVGVVRLQLNCKDGSDSRVTITTGPPRPALEPDGSFYYEEAGRTEPAQFPGFGAGRYRGAMQGTLVGEQGKGSAVFRITFKETSCRASVGWRVKRGGG